MTVVVDLFAGCGGWDLGARTLGLDPIGVELDAAACATRAAIGLRTVRADIEAMTPRGNVAGLIASPPCPDFSAAGKGEGIEGESGRLMHQVPRWVEALRPEWVACEQVPPALPFWREYADMFRRWGYSTWAGVLSAERYGVPQTRERAFLLASRTGNVLPPEPTHQEYVPGVRARHEVTMFGELLPWVSMAEALGWGMTERPSLTLACVDTRRRSTLPPGQTQTRPCSEPAPTLTATSGGQWVVRTGANSMKHSRDAAQVVPYKRPIDCPAPTVDPKAGSAWVFDRPATTVRGDPRLSPPGHHDPDDPNSQHGPGTVKLTLPEGLVLQGFPPDLPVQGPLSAKWRQVGNAVPPPLAAAVLGAVL